MEDNKPLLQYEQRTPHFTNPKHYYEVLGLPNGVSIPEIQQHYIKLQ